MNEHEFAKARRNMVDSQILPNRVTDERLIEAMARLPREAFLLTSRKPLAYVDESILIEDGRYMMQPMVLARLIETAKVQPTDVALVIGGGAGYALALIASLADTVVAVEQNNSLRQKADRSLQELGIDNAVIVDGDMISGHPSEAPFDVILINGAVPEVPDNIARQLSDGGRLVAVEQEQGRSMGKGVVVTRFGQSLSKRAVFDAAEWTLPGFEREQAFTF